MSPCPFGGEHAAAGMEGGGLRLLQVSFLPEQVGAGQRRVPAEVHFGGRGEPPQIEALRAPHQERRLRQVHLRSHLLHPARVTRGGEQAHGRRVAGERAVGEGVDLAEPLRLAQGTTASASISTSISGEISRLTSTMVAAGRMLPKTSPWALPISPH